MIGIYIYVAVSFSDEIYRLMRSQVTALPLKRFQKSRQCLYTLVK